MDQDTVKSAPVRLSRRESEVLGLLAAGVTMPQIAARLFVSRRTVECHVANLHRKAGVHSTLAALAALGFWTINPDRLPDGGTGVEVQP